MTIKKGREYRIKGNSEYFKKKYGTSNPTIFIEGTDIELTGKPWLNSFSPVAVQYANREHDEKLPEDGMVYGGKIKQGEIYLSEFVHESELE